MRDSFHCSCLYIELCLIFYGYTWSTLLVPSCDRILPLVWLLSFLQCLWSAISHIFYFPKGGTIVQDCGFPGTQILFCFMYTLTVYLGLFLLLPIGVCTGTIPRVGEVWFVTGTFIVPWASWGYPQMMFSISFLPVSRLCGALNEVSRKHVSLMPLDNLICYFPELLFNPRLGALALILWISLVVYYLIKNIKLQNWL